MPPPDATLGASIGLRVCQDNRSCMLNLQAGGPSVLGSTGQENTQLINFPRDALRHFDQKNKTLGTNAVRWTTLGLPHGRRQVAKALRGQLRAATVLHPRESRPSRSDSW